MQHFISENKMSSVIEFNEKSLTELMTFYIKKNGRILSKVIIEDCNAKIFHVFDEVMDIPFPFKIIKNIQKLWFYDTDNNTLAVIKYKNKCMFVGNSLIKYYIKEQIHNLVCVEEELDNKKIIRPFLIGHKNIYYLSRSISLNKKYLINDPTIDNFYNILLELRRKNPYDRNRKIKNIDSYKYYSGL